MTKDEYIHIRVDDETKNRLRQLYEQYRLPSMSELLRLLIDFAYDEQRYLEFYIEDRRNDD